MTRSISAFASFFALSLFLGTPPVLLASPLHEAAREGAVDAIKRLIEKGMKPDLPGYEGKTALMEAADARTAAVLLAAGADVNARAKGRTALICAASSRDAELVRVLIKAGAEVNVKTGLTPLFEAAH